MWRRIAIGFGIALVLALAVLAALPLLIDVDQYRGRIEAAANERMNGELDLGALSLAPFWRGVEMRTEHVVIRGPDGAEILRARDAAFRVSLWSLLTRHPDVRVVLESPQLWVVRSPQGDFNLTRLIPERGMPARRGETSTYIENAVLSLEVRDARAEFDDRLQRANYEFDELNLVLTEFGTDQESEFRFWTTLSTRTEAGLSMIGPVVLNGTLLPRFGEDERQGFRDARVTLSGDFTDLNLLMGGASEDEITFQKPAGMPARVQADLTVSAERIEVPVITAWLHQSEFKGGGSLTGFDEAEKSPILAFGIRSDAVDLADWRGMIPALERNDVDGTARFKIEAIGPIDSVGLDGQATFREVGFQGPRLRERVVLSTIMEFSGRNVRSLRLDLTAPGSDLALEGSVSDFLSRPNFQFELTSKEGLDLDRLLLPPPPDPPRLAALRSFVEVIRSNELMRRARGSIEVSVPVFQYAGIQTKNLSTRLSYTELVSEMNDLSFALWEGRVTGRGRLDARSARPSYSLNGEVRNLSLAEAAERFPFLKGLISGTLTASVGGQGSGTQDREALRNLDMSGQLSLSDTEFGWIDIESAVETALRSGFSAVSDQVPQLPVPSAVGELPVSARYESLSTDFRIAKGVFSTENLAAKAVAGRGVDLAGDFAIDLTDRSVSGGMNLIDRYALTPASDLSVRIAGQTVEDLFGDPVTMPVELGCTAKAPCLSYERVAEHFVDQARSRLEAQVPGAEDVRDEALSGILDRLRGGS